MTRAVVRAHMTDVTSHGACNAIVRVSRFDLLLSRAWRRSLARLLTLTHARSRRAVAMAVAVAAIDDARADVRDGARS